MRAMASHDDIVIEELRKDPVFAQEYLNQAIEGLNEEGGEACFLLALRHIVEARSGFTEVATAAGLSRESLYRALSSRGNPTLRTLKKVVQATGLTFARA